MNSFVVDDFGQRVVFAAGALAHLPAELGRLRAQRALVVSTPGRAAVVQAAGNLLGHRMAGVFARAQQHVPRELAREAVAAGSAVNADCCIAIGGGSAIGLAKAIALEANLPIIAIPTTYAGSEATTIWGITEGSEKKTGRDPRVLPRVIIYDPELTLGFPPRASGASGMNAVAHCVEALYAPDCDAGAAHAAEEGLADLGRALPLIVQNPGDLEARSEALRGAYLAGKALGTVSMGLHHKLCHVLGGSFGLPHAEAHAALLPYVVAFNAPAAPAAMSTVARALAGGEAVGAVHSLARTVHAPNSLAELGMLESDLDDVARTVAAKNFPNPRPATYDDVLFLLTAAFNGSLAHVRATS